MPLDLCFSNPVNISSELYICVDILLLVDTVAELEQFPDYVVTDDVPYEHKSANVSLLPKKRNEAT